MKNYGYVRVSSADQNEDRQLITIVRIQNHCARYADGFDYLVFLEVTAQ